MAKKSTTVETPTKAKASPVKEATAQAETSVAVLPPVEDNALPESLRNLPEEAKKIFINLASKFGSAKRGMHVEGAGAPALRPNIVKIRQPTTQSAPDDVKVGELFTDSNIKLGKEFEFIPLNLWTERAKWPEGQAVSNQPQCKSFDGVRGLWEMKQWRECATCPFKEWTIKDGKGSYPCNASINVLSLNEELTDFYRIQFTRSGMKSGKAFHKALTGRNDELFSAVWSIAAEKIDKSPAYSLTKPSISREILPSDAAYAVCNSVMDILEEVRRKREETNRDYAELAESSLRNTLDYDASPSGDASPDLNM